METRVWLCFDLGIQGDVEGMFQFLGRQKAVECCGNSASFLFDYTTDVLQEIKRAIRKDVTVDKRTRVYLIYKKGQSYSGKFVIGLRRTPPWSSYIPVEGNEEDDA